ncbi:hypothetical protein EYF80_006025 [Liparis tanakae]|uniref:Uncharacterized protein n=1 Tax=Liparis tanakae TaxID=230148 RepID=A0A4Z2J0V7_9TELE|nr:hypothetical protein EYF80_006025 [Liparis tanakae]
MAPMCVDGHSASDHCQSASELYLASSARTRNERAWPLGISSLGSGWRSPRRTGRSGASPCGPFSMDTTNAGRQVLPAEREYDTIGSQVSRGTGSGRGEVMHIMHPAESGEPDCW